jgi:hypothetical protein
MVSIEQSSSRMKMLRVSSMDRKNSHSVLSSRGISQTIKSEAPSWVREQWSTDHPRFALMAALC